MSTTDIPVPDTRLKVFRWLFARKLVTPSALLSLATVHIARVLFELAAVIGAVPMIQYLQVEGRVSELAEKYWYWAKAQAVATHLGFSLNLPVLAALMFVSLLGRELLTYAALVRTQRIKENIAIQLCSDLVRAELCARAEHIRRLGAGRFVPLISQHAPSVPSVLINLMTLAMAWFTLAVYGVLFLLMANEVVLMFLILAALGWFLTRRLFASAKSASQQIAGGYTELARSAADLYRSWRLLKLSPSLETEIEQVTSRSRTIASAQMRAIRAAGRIPLATVPLMVGLALIALTVAVDVMAVPFAVVVVWFLAALRAVPLFQTINRAQHGFATLHGPLMEVHGAFEAADSAQEIDNGTEIFAGARQAISFDNVEFSYPGEGEPVLKGITATIPVGTITAVVGPSGAGKTTLVDMMPRLSLPSAGRVLADGVALDKFTLRSLRSRISYLPQAPHLLDDTIAANIALGRPGAERSAIVEACRLADCLDFIHRLPEGFETKLGEAGDRLSGGQRQRIALARAFLASPDILILDEPTTALDQDSEAAILSALTDFRDARGATIVLITHSASLARHADYVVCLRDGQLAGIGAPDDLAEADDWTARFLNQTTPTPAAANA